MSIQRSIIILFTFISLLPAVITAQVEKPRSFSEIAKKVSPAIVSIDTKSKANQAAGAISTDPLIV